MIFDTTANAAKYKGLSPQLDYAMDLVRKIEESGFAFDVELPAGDGVRIVRLNYETSPYEKSIFEAHRKEIDVMVLIEGSETIGWKPVADLRTISREYSEEGRPSVRGQGRYDDPSDEGRTLLRLLPAGRAHAGDGRRRETVREEDHPQSAGIIKHNVTHTHRALRSWSKHRQPASEPGA